VSLLLKRDEGATSQAGFVALERLKLPWVERFTVHRGRTIPVAATALSRRDLWGGVKARWDIGRMRYSVPPGLYAIGRPGADSPVFVSANYKMSFDALRSSLGGVDAWILVLDTKGVNVWCAAGKGTFGTEELVRRLVSVRLGDVVAHRNLILPQLGAPGVSAIEVSRRSGFRVSWGPVRAKDIKAYLADGGKKDEAMRRVTFDLADRMAVAPVELAHALPFVLAAAALASLYALPAGSTWLGRALPAFAILLGAIVAGTLLFPALLPWLPGRAFVVKGALLGGAWAAAAAATLGLPLLSALGGVLVSSPLAGFLAMNFTGSSTFTCQAGAQLEVERSFWPMVASLAAGLGAGLASRLAGV